MNKNNSSNLFSVAIELLAKRKKLEKETFDIILLDDIEEDNIISDNVSVIDKPKIKKIKWSI